MLQLYVLAICPRDVEIEFVRVVEIVSETLIVEIVGSDMESWDVYRGPCRTLDTRPLNVAVRYKARPCELLPESCCYKRCIPFYPA